MAKQKQKTKKELESAINNLSGGIGLVFKKIEHLENMCRGLEEIIIKQAEFFGKKEEFTTYIDDWLKEEASKESSLEEKGSNIENLASVSGSSVPDKASSTNSR